MKSAFLSKAALCICPPVALATSVATIPPVRHAVHRYTAAYEPKVAKKPVLAPCRTLKHKSLASEPSPLDNVPFALTNPPVAAFANVGGGGNGGGGGGGTPGVQTLSNIPPPPLGPGPVDSNSTDTGGGGDAGAVPEPSVWFTMTAGFAAIGFGMRQRRKARVRTRVLAAARGGDGDAAASHQRGATSLLGSVGATIGSFLWAGVDPVRASGKLAQLGSKSLHSAFLAKAALCVCPPVAMVVGTATIPAVRHAVHKATVPSVPKTPHKTSIASDKAPCLPVVADNDEPTTQKLAVLDPTLTWPTTALTPASAGNSAPAPASPAPSSAPATAGQ